MLLGNKEILEIERFDIDQVFQLEHIGDIVFMMEEDIMEKSKTGSYEDVLNEHQQVIFHIENLERELYNGGFYGYYFSSAGDYSEEAANSLRAIGAEKLATLVSRANNKFPGGKVPENMMRRHNLLKQIDDSIHQTWENCTQQFYSNEETLLNYVITYVKRHKLDFSK